MGRIELQDTGVVLGDLATGGVLGSGGWGRVEAVRHRRTGRRYALKCVPKDAGGVPPEVIRESEILAANDHPFLLQMVRSFDAPRSCCILTELLTGGELF